MLGRRLGCGLLVLALVVLTTAPASASAAGPAAMQFTRFSSASDLDGGSFSSAALDGDRLVLASGATSGTWTSTRVDPRASFTRLVASWNADTPAAGRLTV